MNFDYDKCMEIGNKSALAAFGGYDVSREKAASVLGINEPTDFAVWQVIANLAYQAAFATEAVDR